MLFNSNCTSRSLAITYFQQCLNTPTPMHLCFSSDCIKIPDLTTVLTTQESTPAAYLTVGLNDVLIVSLGSVTKFCQGRLWMTQTCGFNCQSLKLMSAIESVLCSERCIYTKLRFCPALTLCLCDKQPLTHLVGYRETVTLSSHL